MKRVVRCGSCSCAAKVTPCGFTSKPYLVCQSSGGCVDDDDGCTFGAKGTPRTGVEGREAYVSKEPFYQLWN